jgi:hypothetical protein
MSPLRSTAMALILAGIAATTVSAQGPNDRQIVPGARVGSVTLGMTSADLYRTMGEPKATIPFDNGSFRYDWTDIGVFVDKGGHVAMILPSTGGYALSSGLSIGSSELALQAQRPAPAWVRANMPYRNSYCYDDGLAVDTYQGKVTGMTVWSKGCTGQRGHFTCFTQRGNMTYVGQCRHDG